MRRMVCICTPLGVHPPYFFPEKAGKDYELSPYLEVLKDFRDDFTVISGLSHPDVGPSHDSIYSFLTARPASGAAGRLPQQHLARPVRGRASSAARRASPAWRCRARASACRGRAAVRPCRRMHWPSSVFAQLFLEGRPDEVQAQARRLRDGQSILDAVRDQARKMQPDLGAGDREKLDEYFTSVRELEQRLAQAEAVVEEAEAEGRCQAAAEHHKLRRPGRQDAADGST